MKQIIITRWYYSGNILFSFIATDTLKYSEATRWSQYLDVITMNASSKNSWLTFSCTASGIHILAYWCVPASHSNLNTKEHTNNRKRPLQMLSFHPSATEHIRAPLCARLSARDHANLKTMTKSPYVFFPPFAFDLFLNIQIFCFPRGPQRLPQHVAKDLKLYTTAYETM